MPKPPNQGVPPKGPTFELESDKPRGGDERLKESKGRRMTRPLGRVRSGLLVVLSIAAASAGVVMVRSSSAARAQPKRAVGSDPVPDQSFCEAKPYLCTDTIVPYEGHYVGHDEPALMFYSNVAGSGNSNTYTLKLPTDPPTAPKQDGTGGTFNFQLHPAFWFGMAMCDTQSAPEFNKTTCVADTDANIFDNGSPAAPDYIGHHPGTAFMEMQFYPPGWPGTSCDPTHWCAALTIDSVSFDQNNNQDNNSDCLNKVGQEPVNFAFITKSGVSDSAADPLNPVRPTPNLGNDLLMNSGDTLTVELKDTGNGFQVNLTDNTIGQTGSMTASIANGFKQVVFNPAALTCTSQAYAFHPMYSTSNEHTRVPWAAHSYNVAFSDEIGHFEYCAAIDVFGECISHGVSDPGGLDADDLQCFIGSSPFVPITGCLDTDSDFDGVPYQLVWPGTNANPVQDALLHPSSVLFTSPLFQSSSGLQNFDRIAFEADLPAIENGCNRGTGAGCVNPPPGTNFYPLFTTTNASLTIDAPFGAPVANTVVNECAWQLGGANIPGTVNKFGGTSTSEYGALLPLNYPGGFAINNFRNVLNNNPCPAAIPTSIAAAIAPSTANTQVGTPVSVFASIVNGGGTTATSCSIAPSTSVPAIFDFQTTDLSNNPIGTLNGPVDIAGGAAQSFVLTFIPTAAFPATGISFNFKCSNSSSAPVTPGVNTLNLSVTQPTMPGSPSVFAALLPESRSVQTGTLATVYATIANAGPGTATGCAIMPLTASASAFLYQQTDPSTNVPIGMANTPADIAAGGAQTYIFALTPAAPIAPTDFVLGFKCTNTLLAPITDGVNTLLFSASTVAPPDIIALEATVTPDATEHVPGPLPNTGPFAVNTINIGVASMITAAADTGSTNLPQLVLSICQTALGACLAAPAPSVTLQVNHNDTPAFAIFAGALMPIPFDPANNRVYVRFKDQNALNRGQTSVAVTTN
jgi:hypothetical protein